MLKVAVIIVLVRLLLVPCIWCIDEVCKSPASSKDPNSRAVGPKYHPDYSILGPKSQFLGPSWALSPVYPCKSPVTPLKAPHYLSPWTPWGVVGLAVKLRCRACLSRD